MPTLKQQQFQLREQAIMTAMYELLAKKGYSATSMDDVAEQVGISKATLYLHFKSKVELTLRVIIGEIEAADRHMRSLDSSLPAIDRLMQALHTGIQRRATMGNAHQIEITLDEIINNPEVQAAEQRVNEATCALIEEGVRQGDIRSDLAVPVIQQFISTMFNIDFNYLLKQGNSVDQICSQVIDLVNRAIRA
jgi:AcrR family transcriptional regulator